MEAALRAGCHYLDLGGLFHMTRRQLALDRRFRRAGLLAVLGMGSAPGIVNVLARAAADRMRRVRSVRVYNGSADFTRYRSPLAFPFSPATVLDELTQEPVVFAGGRFRKVPPLSGAEPFRFDLGRQTVRHSLHSEVATLPRSFRAKGLRDCSFQIAYDPVLLDRLRLLVDLGLADPRPGRHGVAPRDVLLERFRHLPAPPDFVDDRDALSVVVQGADASGPLTERWDLTATPQRDPPLSAVARDTGFPPAIVARMILGGGIPERGVLPPERCVPAEPFLAALAERGLRARVRRTRPKRRYSGRSKR
jgi:saccharopine dehydrogenase-like NADP-dependent oxidoreductase